jgi:hypothetical protein
MRLNGKQIGAIEQLFNSHPAIAAARAILHGQLLSGGIELRRDGKRIDLQPAFKTHIDEVWTNFAKDVVDSFLKFGYAVVVYEEDEESLAVMSRKRRRIGGTGPAAATGGSDAGSAAKGSIGNLMPIVPPIETYDVAFTTTGRGYKRKYLVYGTAPNMATRVDDEARVVVRSPPDAMGNINSPMAVVFDLGSFLSALTELALTAEITNARPRIWTQPQKESNKGGLDPQALFFDTASRDMAASTDGQDNAQQVQHLAMQQQLCTIINSLQTRSSAGGAGPSGDQNLNSFSGGVANGKTSHVPPEVQPSLFSVPRGQEIAPSAGQMPQARGDLEALQRLAIEQFAAAFGVPADLIFQGRFASKTTAQLSLLNTTVAQLGKAVSRVLTIAYRDIYGEEESTDDPVSVHLVTSPLAVSDEVVALHAAGLAPTEIAMPAVLHAIGASPDAIEEAVKKAAEAEQQKCDCEDEDRSYANQEKKMGLEQRKLDLTARKQEVAAVKAGSGSGSKPSSGNGSGSSPGSPER